MSHRFRRPDDPFSWPAPQYELRRVDLCRQLGFPYPPDPKFAYDAMMKWKSDAESQLKTQQHAGAFHLYTSCIFCTELFPLNPAFQEERYKLLCNRSLVLTKLRSFHEAENDALQALRLNPNFVKAHWRVVQAVKGGPDGPIKALPHVIFGLQKVLQGHGYSNDMLDFLTELCILIPKASPIASSLFARMGEVIPAIKSDTWTKVLQKLSAANAWQSVAMLVIDQHSGSSSVLDGKGRGVSCSGVRIESLLMKVTEDNLRNWGEELAVELIKQGASVDEMGLRMNKPPVHVSTDISLITRKQLLLECVLEQYKDSPDQTNAQNSDGSTALHVLVLSGQANTTHGLATLHLLLNYKLNPLIEDNSKKTPEDYLEQEDRAYVVLKTATKTVDELRQDLEQLKTRGTEALKAGKLDVALSFYAEALEISLKSKQLYKEAAILYSNRANVLYKQQQYTDALANSIAATSCDSSYYKGHYWTGKISMALGAYTEAFQAYIDGCNKCSISDDLQQIFIMDAVVLLKQVPANTFMTCYNQLNFLNTDQWPKVLGRMSVDCEWKVLAYLVLGPDLIKKELPTTPDFELRMIKPLCTGVAKSASLREIQMHTVFTYLKEKTLQQCWPWLDTLVTILYHLGGPEVFATLSSSQSDTALHALVRYSLITGSFILIQELPDFNYAQKNNLTTDGEGNSFFHSVTKLRPPPPAEHTARIIQLLLDRGYSAMERDRHGKLAVEHLDSGYPSYLFDMLFSASHAFSISNVLSVKEKGNRMFNAGQYRDAVDAYTEAISVLEKSSSHAVRQQMTNREIASLYGNRAEAYLKLDQYKRALEDAKQSVSTDGHWYKGHLRVAKALRGLGYKEDSLKEFVNAYRDSVDKENIKLEILTELCDLCPQLSEKFDLRKRLPEFPRKEGHMWARAAHKFVSDNKWVIAQLAYYQYVVGNARRVQFKGSLKPFCNLRELKIHGWGASLIQYFLDCSADPDTITIEKGDSFLHAVIRIEFVIGKSIKLLEYILRKFCERGNKHQHCLDSRGNTALHIAAKETGQDISTELRHKMIILLLEHNVDPNVKNKDGKLAIDYLPHVERQSEETLRMAMYGKKNMPKCTIAKPAAPKAQQSPKLELQMLQGCDTCEKMLSEAMNSPGQEFIGEAYRKLTWILKQPHKGVRHEEIREKVIGKFVDKLGESANPDIPNPLTEIRRDFFLQIVKGLACRQKWQQVDVLVRKYRDFKGSEQLKEFAAGMTVVPVISDSSLRGAEDMKLQIVSNLLSSGATFGTDNGVRAIECAQQENHYKVVAKLILEGADTVSLTMKPGDTPIHAALTIVLKKEKVPSLLEYLLDLYQNDPGKYPHLNPEQLDQNGDCLFHILAKANYNSVVMKLTEMLCKRKLSANYYNEDGKLPIHYITRKNDRRQQFMKLASNVPPSQKQTFQKKSRQQDKPVMEDEDLQQFSRPNDNMEVHEVMEVTRTLSDYERRKGNISELIRNLPESKLSVFSRGEERKDAKLESKDFENVDGNTDSSEIVGFSNKKAKLQPEVVSSQYDFETGIQENVNSNCETDQLVLKSDTKLADIDIDSQAKIPMRPEKTESDLVEEVIDAAGEKLPKIVCKSVNDLHDQLAKDNEVTVNEMAEKNLNNKDNEKVQVKNVDEPEKHESEKSTKVADTPLGHDGKETAASENTRQPAFEVHPDLENVEEQVQESEEEGIEDEETEGDFHIDAQVFDNLEWEVECTAEVWKTLREKHVQHKLKCRIVHKIQLLATGDWQPHLCKMLKNVPPSLKLYEAKFSKGSCIIWELAIAFSPRLSEKTESRLQAGVGDQSQAVRGGRIYSEVIRVWEIVFDHDKIHRTVEKIKRSHERGESCIIQKNLKRMRDDPATVSGRRYPRLYAEKEEALEELKKSKQEIQRFFPPASANDTEYHILKFYSFSSVLVSHILQNVEMKVDFPFRVTDLEHAIIHLHSKAPILLLGRSGTGKTTCCLYRLWSQFHTYWYTAKKADAPLMPRCVEFIHQKVEKSDSEEEEDSGSTSGDSDAEEKGSCAADFENNGNQAEEAEECDHLHQLFITKNSVLCSEVQKSFRELSHADEMMNEHVQHEEEKLPVRLQDLHEYSFPVFLTSRQLLLMLDASIGPPHFFERKEDGSLKVDIAGWSDMDGALSILHLLDEDTDMEDDGEQYVEEEQDMDNTGARHSTDRKQKKGDPRREITYSIFVEEIWPGIKKSLQDTYHPSLIWMEIMSFIKGSFEALSKPCGYLLLEEYEKLGRKRAPNFSGQREVIYNCFKRYDHFKKQNSLFDETDLVHDVFCRLQQMKSRSWVIHQIYVDETQDFTQAELCLMIRLCQNPNDMFLTGDTAQSIMRGIAFRFSDLRSLFFHAKKSMQAVGKASAVEVPKQVYQLTHNYRSHAGILALASSILELMVQFFPESFDRLQPDQGLFSGPQPILLESCSFSDLAVLLRGNKRRTSHIEFGAHQAILVVSDAAREAIPEELRLGLVLTIYEAKGLEFDDVLLYNFFKDSQANKEWRVVTRYLEELGSKQRKNPAPGDNSSNLVIIDQEILAQSGRPRPLNFDPNQHKVLNSELKHLYTALTRARVNVWIFDEDKEKRAPMFEFFKVRKLVKSLTVSEINEESLSETVFAEKSSSFDWLRRGEEFMKHHLYQVAAKCFGIGLDKERETVALAHHRALMASRLKDHPKKMHAEFLLAAEMYLNCSKPAKAVVCLQNARENELAAELYEKLGQFERAADIHRKLKQPIAIGRCYEQLGNFNKAIELLYENEEYVMAIDTLRRYNIILQNYKQKGLPVPAPLLENRPADFYTEEKLSHEAAEFFHRNNNERSMLEAVERFQSVDDQVQFLEKRGYIKQAANCRKKHGGG